MVEKAAKKTKIAKAAVSFSLDLLFMIKSPLYLAFGMQIPFSQRDHTQWIRKKYNSGVIKGWWCENFFAGIIPPILRKKPCISSNNPIFPISIQNLVGKKI
jgi:hypothetical protein